MYPPRVRSCWPPLLFLLLSTQLRALVTTLHEGAHAVMVVLTGGQVLDWSVQSVTFSGGHVGLVLGTGYLLPAVLGAGLAWQRWGGRWLQASGVLLILGALLDIIEDRGAGDAVLLAQQVGGSPPSWSGLWILSVLILGFLGGMGIIQRRTDPPPPVSRS